MEVILKAFGILFLCVFAFILICGTFGLFGMSPDYINIGLLFQCIFLSSVSFSIATIIEKIDSMRMKLEKLESILENKEAEKDEEPKAGEEKANI